MIPSFTLKPDSERAVALVTETEGVFVVEPMRFLWPSEAKREARALDAWRCHHNRKRAPKDMRASPSPRHDCQNWQARARSASRCLCEAIEAAGVRP